MKNLIIVIILGVSLYYFKPGLFSFSNQGAFDNEGNPQAWIFTFDQCGRPCDDAISTLDKRINYTEYNVSQESGKQQLEKIGGSNRFPLLIIGNQTIKNNDKWKIISTLAEVMGEQTLTPNERRVLQGHFYDDGTPAIIMYGASWCGYCKQMREYFNKNDIEFTELDGEGSARSEYAALQGTGFPLIYIGYRRIQGANIAHFEKTMNELNL